MNGQEQRERKTAIITLDKKIDDGLKRVEQAALDAFNVEVSARTAAIEECKALFAKMVDDETQFRKAGIVTSAEKERGQTNRHLSEVAGALLAFLRIPWWQRWGWFLIGAKMLLWFPVPNLTERANRRPQDAMAESGQKQRQGGTAAPPPPPEPTDEERYIADANKKYNSEKP